MLISVYPDIVTKTLTFYLSHPLTPEICHPVFELHGLNEVAEMTNIMLGFIELFMGIEPNGHEVKDLSPDVIRFINSIGCDN